MAWFHRKRKNKSFIVPDGNWTPDLLADRDERLGWLMRHQRGMWKLINGNLIAKGDPTMMAEGTFGALGAYPLPVALAAVTPSTTVETQLLTAAQGAVYMPIPANGLLAPQAYRFVIAGITTTSATASNYTWTARMGNSATPATNLSLGASGAIAKTISLTNAFWIVKADLTVQTLGAPGANSKILAHFQAFLNSAVGGAYTSWLWGTGATALSFDSTVAPNTSANGGQFGLDVTSSVTVTDTLTIQQVHFMDWN